MASSSWTERFIKTLSFTIEFLQLLASCSWICLKSTLRSIFFFWPKSLKNINNDVVLITGGGRGLGKILAVEIAKHKPKQIILWGRTFDALSSTANEIEQNLHVQCYAMVCDVSNREEVYQKAELVRSKYGPVSILFNNAGIVSGFDVIDCNVDQMEQTIKTNLLAQIWTCKAFLPAMLDANHGHIVSMNSMLGLMGLPGAADYCASKHGVTGFMESLGMEIEADGYDGVKLTSVHPYVIDTSMFAGISLRFPSLFPPLDPEYVAVRSVEAMLTNSKMIIIPRLQYFLHFINHIMPIEAMWPIQQFTGVSTCMQGFYARLKD